MSTCKDKWELDDAYSAVGFIKAQAAHGLGQAGFDACVVHRRGFDRRISDFAIEPDFPEHDDFSRQIGIGEELLFVTVAKGIGAFLDDLADVGFLTKGTLFGGIHGEFCFLFDGRFAGPGHFGVAGFAPAASADAADARAKTARRGGRPFPLAKSTTPATRASIPPRQINNARNAGVHSPSPNP